MTSLTIGNRTVGDNHPTFVIAEMACGYEGDVKKAEAMIDAAAAAGCDAIKFHMHTLDEYAVPSHAVYDFVKKIRLLPAAWQYLFVYARRKNLNIIAMPNDISSMQLAQHADAFYLHSANAADEGFVRAMAKEDKPILIGTGATTFEEIKKTLLFIKKEKNDAIILMHGYQGYPTKLEENHLRLIPTLRKTFSYLVGSGEHEEGGSEFSFILPLMAMSMGSCVVEKHITIDRKMKLTDYQSALEPAELKRFMGLVRAAEHALGSEQPHEHTTDELNYRKLVKKNIVATCDVPKGTRITRDMLAFKRSPVGISPFEVKKVVGKKAQKTIHKHDVISEDML